MATRRAGRRPAAGARAEHGGYEYAERAGRQPRPFLFAVLYLAGPDPAAGGSGGAYRHGGAGVRSGSHPITMPAIIALALIAIAALTIASIAVHVVFSPWLLAAIAIVAWVKFRPRRSHR
jgi:hypothetical protein